MANRKGQAEKQLHETIKKGQHLNISKGKVIQSSVTRQAINLVVKGYVIRYTVSADGLNRVQSIYGPGDVFPLTAVFKILFNQELYSGPETIYYQAITSAELYSIDSSALALDVEKNNSLYEGLLVEAGKRFHSNIQQLENLSLKTSHQRVAHEILYFAKKFGSKRPQAIIINLPLSHQILADMLSVTRRTVTSSITLLKHKGLITTGRYISVPSIKKLEKEAYGYTSKDNHFDLIED